MRKLLIVLAALLISSSASARTPEGMEDSLNTYAMKFYKQLLAQSPESNMFFSPFSVSSAMAMPYLGAEGATAAEFQKVLSFPEDSGQYSKRWNKMLKTLKNRYKGKAEFRLANSVWVHKPFNLEKSFRNALTNDMQAELFEVNFRNKKQRNLAREKANKWVADITNNKIKNLVTPGMLTPLTRLMLINAIYFKASWKYPFKEPFTEPDSFYTASGEAVEAQFMNNTKSMRYYKDKHFKMAGIPYQHPYLEMFVVLPSKDMPLSKAVELFTQKGYRKKVMGNMRYGRVDLSLPKFRIERRYPLKPIFEEMGMSKAFNDTANFSGIAEKSNLKIDKVVHQTFIGIDEKGTEAAAATAVTMKLKTSIGNEPFKFKANRPFMFFIQDNRTDLIYFAGALQNPAEKNKEK